MPTQVYKQMPRFERYNVCEGDAHVQSFSSFMEKHSFGDQDMWMRFFARYLEAKARDWYLSFPEKSFPCWDKLMDAYRKEFPKEPSDLVKKLK